MSPAAAAAPVVTIAVRLARVTQDVSITNTASVAGLSGGSGPQAYSAAMPLAEPGEHQGQAGAAPGAAQPDAVDLEDIAGDNHGEETRAYVRDKFNEDTTGNLSKADQNWPGLVEKKGK